MKEPVDILRCERMAQRDGFDSMKFTALFPAGPKVCTWLDAYFGFFRVEGLEGFVTTSQMEEEFPGLLCIPHEPA